MNLQELNFKNPDCKAAMQTLLSIPDELKKLENERAKINREHKGDKLKGELQRISDRKRELENTRRTTVQSLQDKLLSTITTRREAAEKLGAASTLDTEAITPDYQFLSLPVKLTQSELQQLHARNWGNVLFARAVKDYAYKQGYTSATFESPYQTAEKRIQSAIDQIAYYTGGTMAEQLPCHLNIVQQWDSDISDALESVGG